MIRAAATWGFYYAFKQMPSAFCSGLGAGLSGIPRRLFKPTHRDTKALFAALRPDWAHDPALLEAAARRAWANVARTYAEVPSCHRIVASDRVVIENIDVIDAVMATGKSVILAFVHTGNWEVSGIQLAERYHPGRRGLAIYDPPRNPINAAIVDRERRRMPADLVPLSRMVWRQAMERLRRPGGALWVPADELAFGRVHAPFFGRPPRIDGNLGKIARLAMRTGAIVLPFYGERHPHLRFTTHILPPMSFAGDAADDGAVLAAVEAIEAVLAPPIIRLIDQWYMALFYGGHPASLPPDADARPATSAA